LTVDQRHRARKAARAVFDRFGMSAGDAIHALQINAKEDK
jgi:hypothetical protein